jgi:hypothetical protein
VIIEFEVEFLVLGAEELRLCRVLYGQNFGVDIFDIVAQLAVRNSVGSESVSNAKDVAECESAPKRDSGQNCSK